MSQSDHIYWGEIKMPNTPMGIDHSRAGLTTTSEATVTGRRSTGPAGFAGCEAEKAPQKREQTVDEFLKGRIEHLEACLTRLRAARVNAFLINVLNAPVARFRHIANEL